MPYTPPSSRSPATSAPASPDISRRPSFHHSPTSKSRPALPQSASYMMKHRRTPSAPNPPRHHGEPSPESTSEDLHGMMANISVRQSPPPVTGDRGMPNGAIISPPDSSSDDDELPEVRLQSRGRPVEPAQLHHAVIQIPQQRPKSPTPSGPKERQSSLTVDVLALPSHHSGDSMRYSMSDSSLVELAAGANRKISHTRSATEPQIMLPQSSEVSLTGSSVTPSDEESEEEFMRKPPMVRKKSGELVRPALRASSRGRRPSSMPGTPTYSKAVHFDSHLEHVRHFLQVDRPLAVSAGSSPAESYESDTEYPFSAEDRSTARSPPTGWEIVMTKFPVETPARKAQVVRLERVWLSTDQKCLIGSIVVANLAFQKQVACRFTLDYWKTTSEVAAEYVCEVRPAETPRRDRFHFTIKLSDLANLESKTLYFCIRYNVNGQEYWDNNNGMNFQVDFLRKHLPQNGKRTIGAASRPANGLPKSSRRSNPSTSPRPRSMPVSNDEFATASKLNFDQSIEDYLGESEMGSIRLKGVKSSSSLPTDDLSARLAAPSGRAFKGRYDFTASLTAALQTAKDQSDDLYMKPNKKAASASVNATKSPASSPTSGVQSMAAPGVESIPKTMVPVSSKPAGSPPSGSPTAISSATYDEIINKFCFVRISR